MAAAEAQFINQFPNGYITVQPNTTEAMCGLCALRDSIHAQIPTLPRSATSIKSLATVLADQAKKIKDFEMDNVSYLRLDQLGLVLQEFLKTSGICAQLGVIYVPDLGKGNKYGHLGRFYQGKKRGYILLDRDITTAEVRTVWIFNDNRTAEEWKYATWCGIKPAA